MDVLFLNTSVFDIPSSRRVDAIVHDGTSDLSLWPGPSHDRDLRIAYVDGLKEALDTERKQAGVEAFERFQVVRVHPGRLHCDFLAWVVTRDPEPGTERHAAPSKEDLKTAVTKVLEFVSTRDVQRVAFPALGDGPSELDPAERLEIICRAANDYHERCFAAGRPAGIEEVLICHPSTRVIGQAKRKVQRLARTEEVAKPESAKPATKKRATKGTGRKRSTGPALDQDELARQRSLARPYTMRETYSVGEWFTHKKFGVGCVQEVLSGQGFVDVLFEDGSVKRLVHGR